MTSSPQAIPGLSSPRPRSLRSVDSTSSSPLELSSATLALLGQFQEQKAEETERFRRLEEQAERRRREAQGATVVPRDGEAGAAAQETQPEERMSVDDFRRDFGESWQLSQFWYSAAFSRHLAGLVHAQLADGARLAFISCPTAYVGFQHEYNRGNTYLLEYDTRFALLSEQEFVRYDLDEPLALPKELLGSVDFMVVDPPFLNEATCRKVAQSVKALLAPQGRMLLLTGRSVSDTAKQVYAEVAGVELRDTQLTVEHAGGLANDFGAWASWQGAETWGARE